MNKFSFIFSGRKSGAEVRNGGLEKKSVCKTNSGEKTRTNGFSTFSVFFSLSLFFHDN